MKLILNADDFGFSDETVDATIECFEKGALTSATIMPSMPAVERAAAYAREHPQFSFGVHLTYVGDGIEPPLTDPAKIPDLCWDWGKPGAKLFLPSQKGRLRGLMRRTSIDQIALETEAQLTKMKSLGVPISHVDSHGHLHKFWPYRQALRRVLPKFGITKVRSAQDVYLKKPLKSPTYWLGPHWKRALAKLFTTTEHLYLPRSAVEADWTRTFLALPLGGVVEVGLHPGYATEKWREEERADALLLSQRAREGGHQLVTWREVG